MTAINVAIVSGKVGEPGTLRTAGTGEPVTNFTLMYDEVRKERGTGKPRKVKGWHRITAYDDLAKFAATLPPQTGLLIQGRFQNNRRVANGVAQHSVDIIAEKIEILAAAN